MHETTFEYLKPTEDQVQLMTNARNGFRALSDELDDLIPDGPDKTHVMRTLRTAAMWTNIAITRQPDGAPRTSGGGPGVKAVD